MPLRQKLKSDNFASKNALVASGKPVVIHLYIHLLTAVNHLQSSFFTQKKVRVKCCRYSAYGGVLGFEIRESYFFWLAFYSDFAKFHFRMIARFSVALEVALKKSIKIVRNRAEIVKKQESLNPCFYWC